jgi:para-nitrobenzyl esterase
VWCYELGWGFGPDGATHGLDTLLMFGTAHVDTGLAEAGPDAMAQARPLSELIRSEHVAFATTGDPGWARYEPHGRVTRVYDTESTVVRYPEQRSREIWRDQRFDVLDLLDDEKPTETVGTGHQE